MIGTILLVIITILMPPIGVFLISGCSADLLINICLTVLGYIPGHVHAFYLEYVYYHRQEAMRNGEPVSGGAPGVYSDRILSGGERGQQIIQPSEGNQSGYGTV